MDPITLQELLDELAREGGNLSEFLTAGIASGRLTVESADALLDEAATTAEAVVNAEARTAADVATLSALADTVDAVRASRTELVTAAEAEAAQIAELAARIAPVAEAEDTATDADPETDGDADPDNSDSGLTAQDIVDAEVVDLTDSAAEPEPVLASTSPRRPRVDLGNIVRRTQRPNPADLPVNELPFGGSLVASAEAPGVRGGSAFTSWLDVANVAAKSFSASPSSLIASSNEAERSGGRFYQRNGVLEMRKQFPDELVATSYDATDAINAAVDQSRLKGGSLLAAGGWCSPSEQLWDLCDLPCTNDGILSIPEINASRGGVKWIKSLDWCAIFNAEGFFHFTEAEMQAEPRPDKPCMEIPCPEEEECRLDVDGLCITADIMMSRTFPELISQFIQGALCAHAHRVNANVINQIVAGSPSIGTITQAGYGATASILYAIEMQIQAYRYRGRRAQEGNPALLELVAPYWIKAIVRADLANRPGYPESALAITDAMIVNWFATRGVAVRFVYDWQDLTACPVPPATTVPPITDYPNTVEFILYEAGTWVKPSLDVITLETLYDSALIRQNKYQALFTEEAFCVINRCNDSIRFTVPVCASGAVGAETAVVCA